MKMQRWLLTLVLFGVTPLALAQTEPPSSTGRSAQMLRRVRHLAIQAGGRLKPFDSFARETLTQLTSQPKWEREDPVETLLNLLSDPSAWQEVPILSVPFVPLREALGLDAKTTHVSYQGLVSTRKLMRMLPAIVQKQQQDEKLTMLENETMDLYGRFVTITRLFQQELYLVPPPEVSELVWLPILKPVGTPEGSGRRL